MIPRTDKELKELAYHIFENKVFGSWSFRSESDARNLMGSVFMCALFISEDDRKKLADSGANHFYEYYDRSLPRSINGYPIFMSMRFVLDEEWPKITKYIKELEKQRKEFMGDESEVSWVSPMGGN